MPLNPVARSAIEELRRVFHVADLTPDEIVEINDLGAAQMAAGKGRGELAVASPIKVGNTVLHPLTLAALDFIDRWSEEPLTDEAKFGIIPFALAFGRKPEELNGVVAASEIQSRVCGWLASLDVSRAELEEACTAVLRSGSDIFGTDIRDALVTVCDWMEVWNKPLADTVRCEATARLDEQRKERETESRKDSAYWRRLSFELGALTGVEPDYWYRQDRALALVAYKAAYERDAFRAGGTQKDHEKTELISSIARLRKAMLRIVNLRKARDAEKEGAK